MRTPKTDSKRPVAKKTRKAGKPYKPLPVEMAAGFGQLGLTQADIAGILKISVKTVNREFVKPDSEFASEYRKGKAKTSQSLRMKLLQRAIKEDRDSLLQFALKNFCGMKEQVEVENSGEVTVNITMGGKEIEIPKWLEN
jgi:hypothetical protein